MHSPSQTFLGLCFPDPRDRTSCSLRPPGHPVCPRTTLRLTIHLLRPPCPLARQYTHGQLSLPPSLPPSPPPARQGHQNHQAITIPPAIGRRLSSEVRRTVAQWQQAVAVPTRCSAVLPPRARIRIGCRKIRLIPSGLLRPRFIRVVSCACAITGPWAWTRSTLGPR